jgi:hypothetical protein
MLGSCEACTVYALIGGSRADGVTDTVHAGVEGKCGWDKNLLKKVKLRWRRTVLSELRKLEDWGMLCQPLWFVFSALRSPRFFARLALPLIVVLHYISFQMLVMSVCFNWFSQVVSF